MTLAGSETQGHRGAGRSVGVAGNPGLNPLRFQAGSQAVSQRVRAHLSQEAHPATQGCGGASTVCPAATDGFGDR